MEIKLPKDKTGLRIKHIPAFQDVRLAEVAPSVSLKIDTLHKFTAISKPRLWTIPERQLSVLFNHLMMIASEVDDSPNPPKEIEINGQWFELVDFEKVPAGWHADNEASDYVIDPVRLACICYIPKGTYYGEIDRHENLLYPISSRHELFAEHFPLEAYYQLTTFFLLRFHRSMNAFTEKSIRKLKRRRNAARVSSIGRVFLMPFRKKQA